MINFNEELKARIVETENIIYGYLPSEEGNQKTVIEAMNYSIKAGGKRIRPLLMKETANLFGYAGNEVNPFMAAMEMIHTYSLVHDDLPAMDNDEIRRGLPTTHIKYGHAIGILAGDALLNYAFELCANAIVESSNVERTAKAFKILSEKAGIYGMIGGQTVDIEQTNKENDKDTLDFIYRLKTGALIEGAMMAGAVIAGASDEEVKKAGQIALAVGMAFQIKDDLLDVESTTKELGKPVLSDEKNVKTTYVTLYGIEKSKEMVKSYMNEAITILDGIKYKNEFLKELLISLITRRN